MAGDTYRVLREQWKPKQVRLLLIGESAPDPGQAAVRFFYARTLTAHDNLFRGVVLALYGWLPGSAGDPKGPWLERLKADGVFLIDLVPFPVNALSGREKSAARRAHVAACIQDAVNLNPEAVAVCHAKVVNVVDAPLRAAGLKVIHDQALPFPIGNCRQRFADELGSALKAAGLGFQRP